MRIGIFTDAYPPLVNGVATVSALLNKVFTDNGHTVFVVTVSDKNIKKSYEVNGNIIGISSKALKNLYDYRRASLYPRIAAHFISSLNLDIIHVQTELTIGIFARLVSRNYRIPVVYTYHTTYEDYTYYVTKGNIPFDAVAKKLVGSITKVLTDISTEFTTTSIKTSELIRKYGSQKYINVVPNGLDLALFLHKDYGDEIAEFKKAHDLEDKFIILLLGRLAQEKSYDVVLDNIDAYLDQTGAADIRILIVGSGPAEEELKARATRGQLLGRVEFIGKVNFDETAFYYYLADIFISASLTETQGLTFIEAMACGLPVIARYDECLNGVIADKINGFFFNDREDFIEVLQTYYSFSPEEKRQMSLKACDLVAAKYSPEHYYEAMLDVYNRALRKFW